ncbi:MAG: radical SAM protein [Planctomycetota bacterium]
MKSPRSVTIAITGKCNLACKHCFYADEMRKYDDLPTDRWLAFIKECGDAAVMYITLTGGEPFMRPDIFEIIDAIVKNRMRFSILTNGTLVTKDIAKRIADTGRVRRVQVSVDGDEASHEWMRGKGTYKKALDAVRFLSDAGVFVGVAMSIPKYKTTDVYSAVKAVKYAGAGVATLSYPLAMGSALDNQNEFNCPHDERCSHNERPVIDLDERLEDFEDILTNLWSKERSLYSKNWYPQNSANKHCRIAEISVFVSSEGVISPCSNISLENEIRIGDAPLSTIWSLNRELVLIRQGKKEVGQLCPSLRDGRVVFTISTRRFNNAAI